MTDLIFSSPLDNPSARSKGRSHHRRTQSNTAFDMNALLNLKPDPQKFEDLTQTHNVVGVEATQKALDAAKNSQVEKEVIIDDIDDIPNSGWIVPRSISSQNNPMSFIKRRNLSACNGPVNNGCPIKKIDLHTDTRRIDDLTGLNTIYEKRNSIEELETEAMEEVNSHPVSIAHSKNPSQHHSRNSSQKLGLHSKHSSADFRPIARDSIHSSNDSHEPSPRKPESFAKLLGMPTAEYVEKKNLLRELHRTGSDSKVREPVSMENKSNFHAMKNLVLPQNINKQRAQYFLNILEGNKPKLNQGPQVLTAKPSLFPSPNPQEKPREILSSKKAPSIKVSEAAGRSLTPTGPVSSAPTTSYPKTLNPKMAKDFSEKALVQVQLEKQIVGLDEVVKNLTNKTGYLEEQVRSLMMVIDALKTEKSKLDTRVKDQEHQIKYLQFITSRYEEEIHSLKTKSTSDSDKKSSVRNEISTGNNILNTTDASNHESPFPDSSGLNKHRNSKLKLKTSPFSLLNYQPTSQKITQKKIPEKVLGEFKTSLKKAITAGNSRKSTGRKP